MDMGSWRRQDDDYSSASSSSSEDEDGDGKGDEDDSCASDDDHSDDDHSVEAAVPMIKVEDIDADVLALAEFLGMERLLLAVKVRWYHNRTWTRPRR